MQIQPNNIYIANPIDVLQEFDSNQFDLIYLDPPYYESNIFKKRDVESPYQSFEEYLEYIVGIIFQSHRVLKDSGSILLRINPLSLFNARLFLDRLFGKQNFRAEIVWGRRNINRFNNTVPYANFENVFFYSKTDNFIYNEPVEQLSKEDIKKQYSHKDEKGLYKLWPLTDKVLRPERSFEWKGVKPPKNRTWKFTKARLFELDEADEIDSTGSFPRRKIHLTNERVSSPSGFIWNDFPQMNLKNSQFDLRIQKAIEMTSNPNAAILSLFTDLVILNSIEKSNTELAANRQWIGITPFDIYRSILHSQDFIENNLDQTNYLKNAQQSIRLNITEKQEVINRGEIPNHIRRLISAETQSIDFHTLPKSFGQKHAFVVGINHYRPGIGDLNYCVNDALELSQTFQSLGYQVKALHDDADDENLFPIKSNIETELITWTQSLNPEDTLYVHFSCHGTLNAKNAMLIASDTRIQRIANTALDLQEIIAIMKNGRARKLVLSLDVCHGGVDLGRALIDQEFIKNVYEKAEGFVLLAASTARQQAYEVHEHRHGLFTYFLIQGLNGQADRDDDGIISADDLRNYTLDQISRWNAQNGGFQEPTYRAEGIGEIMLVSPQR